MEGSVLVYKNKKYSPFWAVLEGQQLAYYQKLDKKLQEPIGIQGVLFIQNADISKAIHQGRSHCISIRCENKKSYDFMDCETNQNQSEWYKALIKAKTWHLEERKRLEAPMQNRSILSIPVETKLSQKIITKAYRKLCLKAHPDKGGDVSRFSEIHQAYTYLMAIQVELDEKAQCEEIDYDAVIEKAGGGVGLGIVVLEDPVTHKITVQTVQKNICLQGLSEEANREILPGDVLVAIDRDDCRMWPLSRVRARLNSYRVPIGSAVRMTLRRRVPRETISSSPEQDVTSPATEPQVDQDVPVMSIVRSSCNASPPTSPGSEDSSVQDGNITPKASPRSRKKLSISPAPSPPESPDGTSSTNISGEPPGLSTPQNMSKPMADSSIDTAERECPLGKTPQYKHFDNVPRARFIGDSHPIEEEDESLDDVFIFDDIDDILDQLDDRIDDESPTARGKAGLYCKDEPYPELRELHSLSSRLQSFEQKEKSLLERCELMGSEFISKEIEFRNLQNERTDAMQRFEDLSSEITELREKNIALMAVLGKNEGEHSASKLMRNTEDLIASRRDCSQALNHVNAAKFFMKEQDFHDGFVRKKLEDKAPTVGVPDFETMPQELFERADETLRAVESQLSQMCF